MLNIKVVVLCEGRILQVLGSFCRWHLISNAGYQGTLAWGGIFYSILQRQRWDVYVRNAFCWNFTILPSWIFSWDMTSCQFEGSLDRVRGVVVSGMWGGGGVNGRWAPDVILRCDFCRCTTFAFPVPARDGWILRPGPAVNHLPQFVPSVNW